MAAGHRVVAQYTGLGFGGNLHGTDHCGVRETAVRDEDEVDRSGSARSLTVRTLRQPFSGLDCIRDTDRRKTFHPEATQSGSCRNQLCHRYRRHETNGACADAKSGGYLSQEMGGVSECPGMISVRRRSCLHLVIKYAGSHDEPSTLWRG